MRPGSLESVHQLHGEDRARRADRVAEGDRPAVRIELVRGQAQRLGHGHGLGGEGLVQLDDVDVVDRLAGQLERLRDRPRRRVAHDRRLDARDRPGAQHEPRCKAPFACLREPHEQHGGRAVVDAGGVARRHRAALLEDGLQAGQLLRRGRARVLVLDERLTRTRGLDRDDLLLEAALLDRICGSLLAEQRERILLLAGDALLLRDVLGRDAHLIPAERIGQQGERPVDLLVRAEPPAGARAIGEERLAAHRLVAAGDDDPRLAREDRLRAAHDRLQARGAEAIDVHRRRRRRKPCAERATPGVVGIGPDLGDLAHDDLVDLSAVDPHACDQLADACGAEIGRLDVLERSAEATDGSAYPSDEGDRVVVHHPA